MAIAQPCNSTQAFQDATRPRRIAVVVNADNPVEGLGRAEIRRIFRREKTMWTNGWAISVFERSTDQPIRGAFTETVLDSTPAAMANYWLNLALTRGLEPPKLCRTAALLKHYLERVRGGVGYVYEDEIETGMKVIARFDTVER